MDWQSVFPKISEKYASELDELTSSELSNLSNILDILDSAKLLDAAIFELIIQKQQQHFSYIEQLTAILSELSECREPLLYLRLCIHQGLPAYAFQDALTIFKYSSYELSEENLSLFTTVVDLLKNPMCKVIFDVRQRCFGMYSDAPEPLIQHGVANHLLNSIKKQESLEENVKFFFDYFAKFRPFPNSQRDIRFWLSEDKIEYLRDCLLIEAHDYCQLKIDSIKSKSDYDNVIKYLATLKKNGGDTALFEAIKYKVAAAVEFEDTTSDWLFAENMKYIENELAKPLIELSDFNDELAATGYDRSDAELVSKFSGILSTQEVPEKSTKVEDKQQNLVI